MQLSKLPESILLQVVWHLSLQELQQLAQTSRSLRELVFNNPHVWQQQVLFPKNARITDKFIRHFVPHINRHHGVQTLKLEQLPLGWLGYLNIFDQFAHSVDCIHVETSYSILQDLVYHLTVFAGNLTILQQDNHIPITFRQYGLDATFYHQVLVDHQLLGKSSLTHLTQSIGSNDWLSNLDDPPFENLQHWTAICTDHPQGNDVQNCLSQLESLISFLAGRQVTHPGGSVTTKATITNITGYKRTQDHLDTSTRQKQRLVSSAAHTSSLYV